MIRTIFAIIGIVSLVGSLVIVFNFELKQNEKMECLSWQHKGIYFAEWKIQQCETFGIDLLTY
jgi:hypothetical protein